MPDFVKKIKGKGVLRDASGEPIPADYFENEPTERMHEQVKRERAKLNEFIEEHDISRP